MNASVAVGVLAASYALGSVSFADLVARSKGVDLRKVGSGNLGATNAGRALGRGWGFAIYALDLLKGLAPVCVARALSGDAAPFGDGGPPLPESAGFAAFVGHCYPVWHGFRGGKGVATASGLVLASSPWAALAAFAAFGLVVAAFRMISLGSVVASLVLPFAHVAAVGADAAFGGGGRWVTGLFALIAVWVIVRHRSNLARVFAGTEARIGGARAGVEGPKTSGAGSA